MEFDCDKGSRLLAAPTWSKHGECEREVDLKWVVKDSTLMRVDVRPAHLLLS